MAAKEQENRSAVVNSCILCALLTINMIAAYPTQVRAGYFVRQLTDNTYADLNPQIFGSTIAWYEWSDIQPSMVRQFGPNQHVVDTLVDDSGFNLQYSQVVYSKGVIDNHPPPRLKLFASDNGFLNGPHINDAKMPKMFGSHLVCSYRDDGLLVFVGNDHFMIPDTVGVEDFQLDGKIYGMGGDPNNPTPGGMDSYVVYKKTTPAGELLRSFNIATQVDVPLTDPAYTWDVGEFDLSGSQVTWSASYSENGPEYADREIYAYDLAQGSGSLEQVTQNAIEDTEPRISSEGRLGWVENNIDSFGNVPVPTVDRLMLREVGGVPTAHSEAEYDLSLDGISDTSVFWQEWNSNGLVQLQATTNGKTYHLSDQDPLIFGWETPRLSGMNMVWSGETVLPAEPIENDPNPPTPGGDHEIWAAFYIGPEAVLTYLDLDGMELADLSLVYADLRYTSFRSTLIEGTDFRGADFTGATNLQYAIGQAIYSHRTILPEGFDAQAAGWSYVTPEPRSVVLFILGLLSILPTRRRSTVMR